MRRNARTWRTSGASSSGLGVLTLISIVVLLAASRAKPPRRWVWIGVAGGAATLGTVVVALGIFFGVAFDTAFDLFHRLFFGAGSYTFNPLTERLVQIFPEDFWFETSLVLAVVLILLSVVAIVIAIPRIDRSEPAARTVEPSAARRIAGHRVNGLMASGIPIARIFGIEIRVHLSWIVILAIITLGVNAELSSAQPAWSDELRWAVSGVAAVLFFCSVLVHELAHGVVAQRRGIPGGSVTLLFFGGTTQLPAGCLATGR